MLASQGVCTETSCSFGDLPRGSGPRTCRSRGWRSADVGADDPLSPMDSSEGPETTTSR